MTLYELLDLSMGVGSRIDVQISIFITVHLAIFGGVIYVDRPLQFREKIGSIFIYSVFAMLNYRIMNNQLDLSLQLATEIAKLAEAADFSNNGLVLHSAQELASGIFDWRYVMLGAGHLVFYVIVVLAIVFDEALSNKGQGSGSNKDQPDKTEQAPT